MILYRAIMIAWKRYVDISIEGYTMDCGKESYLAKG